jgi:hypothetical protein
METPALYLEFVSSGDPRFAQVRATHYIASLKPDEDKNGRAIPNSGVVLTAKQRKQQGLKFGDRGQQVHFLIWYNGEIAGIISGGGAVKCTAARDKFFGVDNKEMRRKDRIGRWMNGIVDNTVYCLTNHEKGLFGRVLSMWEKAITVVWQDIYGFPVYGFETFIEPDPTVGRGDGRGYIDTGWKFVGMTAGKAVGHPQGTGMNQILDEETGKKKSSRVYASTKPKGTFCKWRRGFTKVVEGEYASSWKGDTPEEKYIAKRKTGIRKLYLGKKLWTAGDVVLVDGEMRQPWADFLIWQAQQALTLDLLKPEWREKAVGQHKTFGHCYTVTEFLYHQWGRTRGYKPQVVRVPEMDNTTHWYLKHPKTGHIVDGTKEQFEFKGIRIPYENGKGCGLQTKDPSQRCQDLMRRIAS